MKKNVGTWDALLRITVGLVGVAWATSRMSRWPYRTGMLTRAVLWLSAMKVAEGITRFCPVFFAMGLNSEGLTIRWKKTGAGTALKAKQTNMEKTAAAPTAVERTTAERTITMQNNGKQPYGEQTAKEQNHAGLTNAETPPDQSRELSNQDQSDKNLHGANLPPHNRVRPEPIRVRQIRHP
mgnify:CR=1 FL=1